MPNTAIMNKNYDVNFSIYEYFSWLWKDWEARRADGTHQGSNFITNFNIKVYLYLQQSHIIAIWIYYYVIYVINNAVNDLCSGLFMS